MALARHIHIQLRDLIEWFCQLSSTIMKTWHFHGFFNRLRFLKTWACCECVFLRRDLGKPVIAETCQLYNSSGFILQTVGVKVGQILLWAIILQQRMLMLIIFCSNPGSSAKMLLLKLLLFPMIFTSSQSKHSSHFSFLVLTGRYVQSCLTTWFPFA